MMLRACCCVMVCALCVLGTRKSRAGPAGQADYYVGPDGRDTWSGRLPEPDDADKDGPFATIERARDAVREARTGQPEARPFTVLIRGGVYRLRRPIVFEPEDSGTPGAPVTYAAYPGERPVFSGALVIGGWQQGERELWRTEIPSVREGGWYFRQLFVNGRRRTRARHPNEGYLRTAGPLPGITNPHEGRRDRDDPDYRAGFTYREGDLKQWDSLDEVNIFLYHSWTCSIHWIDALHQEERTVRFATPTGWPVGYWEREQRYHLENFREALDSPGEWYLDRATGFLHYWPLPGEDITKAEVVAPVLEELFLFEGSPEQEQYVEHLVLRGLSFQHAGWSVGQGVRTDQQAAVWLKGALTARGARHLRIEDCEIAHVGKYGLWLAAGCADNVVTRCHIHDLGAGGVKLGETRQAKTANLDTQRNVVDNCFIHDGGHVFRAGVGVWIGRSSHNQVTHNEICDFDYTGVSVGWSWGYAASTANHNAIEYNHIHHIGRGVLSDMGGIYTLGVSPGTTLRHNLIHDIYSYSYGGWGLYTDEGSTEILLENNVVYNTKTGGFHQHYGRENVVRNNILAFAVTAQLQRSREEDHLSFDFQRNIVFCDNGLMLGGNWGNGNYAIDNNLYWDNSGEEPDFGGYYFDAWQALGRDENSRFDDPLFVDAENRDFALKPGSPALDLGFELIDVSEIGLYGDSAWVKAPLNIVRPQIDIPPLPRPGPLVDDFEETAVGGSPALARVSGEEQGASIRVTDETAATGQHSLKFTDVPGLKHIWQPHMYYQPHFRKGTTHLNFRVRLEEGAILWHEWRDAAGPYRVGPSLTITADGKLHAAGEELLSVPRGVWVRVEITCAVGREATGSYDLTVTLPGEAPRRFEALACRAADFRRLEWLGFVSHADAATVLYLDDLRLTNDRY